MIIKLVINYLFTFDFLFNRCKRKMHYLTKGSNEGMYPVFVCKIITHNITFLYILEAVCRPCCIYATKPVTRTSCIL